MRTILTVLFAFFLSTNVWAQGPQYEANVGLIFVGFTVLFYDSQGPLSYQTMTPQEIPKDAILLGEVVGESCQHGLSIPIIFAPSERFSVSGAKGDGSYKKALLDIHQKHPHLDGVYDVKVDIRRTSIITIYSRNCTIVHAQGFKHKDSKVTSTLSSQ